MSFPLTLVDHCGERRLSPQELPLSIGGPGADLELRSCERTVAYVALDGGDLFVQPADREAVVRCNGTRLLTSQWLRHGDRLEIGRSEIVVELDVGGCRLTVDRGPAATSAPEEGDRANGKPLLVRPSGPPPTGRARSEETAEPPAESVIRPVHFEPRPLHGAGGGRRLSDWKPSSLLLALVGLLVLGGAVWLLLSARAISIEVEPSPDRLEISGALPTLPIGGQRLALPGRYSVVAEKEGYSPLTTELQVTEETQQNFTFSLLPLPGLLRLETVAGAVVIVDGTEIGSTPLPPLELAAGSHRIAVRASGYVDFGVTVEIEGGGREQRLEIPLVARAADITLSSRPSGARVELDGEPVGETPLTFAAPEGEHRITLTAAGYEPYRQTVRVAPDQDQTLGPFTLRPAPGKLALRSEPPGASVLVDGTFRGETPVELALSPERSHTLSLSLEGYSTAERQLVLAAGARRELVVELTPRLGRVELSVHPADAEVLVDGESLGPASSGSRLFELPATEHRLEVRRKGYEAWEERITPRPGYPLALEVRLRTEREAAEASRPTTPTRLTSAAGQVLILVQPGRFRMGASRREAGRRANETLREVELTRPFYLAATEVTNRQFRAFDPEHRSGAAGGFSLDGDDQPVVNVDWQSAALYCNWLSEQEGLPPVYSRVDGRLVATRPIGTGYRLPTEAEWAWVARYRQTDDPLKYPWGETLPVRPGSGNYADTSARDILSGVLAGYDDGYAATAPVESFAADQRGFFGLGGNVAEWVQDLYTIYPPEEARLEKDPLGPDEGELHVIRGSSWMHSTVTELRFSYRDYGNEPQPDLGFRIARYAGPVAEGGAARR